MVSVDERATSRGARFTEERGPSGAPKPPSPSPSTGKRVLAAGAAFVPGLLVHGSGNWVLGQTRTAKQLLLFEGIGIGALVGSLGGLALTGASRHTVAPLALGAIGGLGLFTSSFLADVYGVLAPAGGTGTPETRRARLELKSGVRYVYDPLFSYRYFASHGFVLDAGFVALSPSFDLALDANNRRYRLGVSRRLFGKTAALRARSGSLVDLAFAATEHAYHEEGFGMTTLEVMLDGRLDLDALDPRLFGAFVEAGAGYARQWLRYDAMGAGDIEGDSTDELLARIGFGMYLGPRGLTKLAYDHRRDTLAGGLRFPGIGAGYAGHLESSTQWFFSEHAGAALELQYGSAFVAGAFLLLRPGGQP